MKQIIVVTGASSKFGRMAAQELAKAGHTVDAGIRETARRNAPQVAALAAFAPESSANLRAVERIDDKTVLAI